MRVLIVEDDEAVAAGVRRSLEAEGLELGADDFLSKQFSMVVVLTARLAR